MCGIAGFLDPGGNRGPESMRRHVIDMTNALAHRGPDDEGAWVDPSGRNRARKSKARDHRPITARAISPCTPHRVGT